MIEYYGDNVRWFIATVIDSSPPYGCEGRVQIRIHGLHSESTGNIPQHDLPFAQCVLPTTEGGVSGIGRVPNIQPNALVFGFFMDGKDSQVPIVIGSLPHIEAPTSIQLERFSSEILVDTFPTELFIQTASQVNADEEPIENETTGTVSFATRQVRERVAVRFFLSLGYSEKQAIGLTAGLSRISNMELRETGIADFSEERYRNLKNFSTEFNTFLIQLQFVAFELNGSQTDTNIRLLQSDKLEGKDGTCEIVAKYYLRKPTLTSLVEQTAKELVDRIL